MMSRRPDISKKKKQTKKTWDKIVKLSLEVFADIWVNTVGKFGADSTEHCVIKVVLSTLLELIHQTWLSWIMW